jgi:flagellin-like hook-associated protein FlgL
MYYLGSILEQGYFAHTVMNQAFNRTEEAVGSLDMSMITQNTKDAVVINNLLKGETAAQGRTIYNSNSAISMIQTFDAGVDAIGEQLNAMRALATKAATGVYGNSDVAVMQDQFMDGGKRINRITKKTRHGTYTLLDNDQKDATFYVGHGHSISIDSRDLGVDTRSIDFMGNAAGAVQLVDGATLATQGYKAYLKEQLGVLAQQVAMADYDISKAMNYNMDVPNIEFAKELANQVITDVMADNITALHTQGNTSSFSLALIQDDIEQPYLWQYG